MLTLCEHTRTLNMNNTSANCDEMCSQKMKHLWKNRFDSWKIEVKAKEGWHILIHSIKTNSSIYLYDVVFFSTNISDWLTAILLIVQTDARPDAWNYFGWTSLAYQINNGNNNNSRCSSSGEQRVIHLIDQMNCNWGNKTTNSEYQS